MSACVCVYVYVCGFEEQKMTDTKRRFHFELCSLTGLDQRKIYGFIYSECCFITDEDCKGVHRNSSLTSSTAFRTQLTLFQALTS